MGPKGAENTETRGASVRPSSARSLLELSGSAEMGRRIHECVPPGTDTKVPPEGSFRSLTPRAALR